MAGMGLGNAGLGLGDAVPVPNQQPVVVGRAGLGRMVERRLGSYISE